LKPIRTIRYCAFMPYEVGLKGCIPIEGQTPIPIDVGSHDLVYRT